MRGYRDARAPERVLITGGAGQLGSELQRTVPGRWEIRALDLPELDITSTDSLRLELERFRPTIVINAAAYTAVDRAESELPSAFAANEAGPANLAAEAETKGFRLIHVSTDFVFDGKDRDHAYAPTDAARPLGVYGASKLAGERRVLESKAPGRLVVRTAWLYSANGSNFVRTILRLLKERDHLRVVADQTGSPTWARSLAQTLWRFAQTEDATGIFHWVDSGEATWHEFAVAIQEEALAAGLITSPIPIEPIATSDFPLPAMRPGYSVLDCSATVSKLGLSQRPWRYNLRAMMQEMSIL